MPSSPEPPAREQLLRLQREIFSRLEDEIHHRQSKEGRDLRLYRRRYDREVKGYRKVSSKSALIEAVDDSDIVYCGDFHTLSQAQKIPVKILAPVVAEGRKAILALEMVPKNLQGLANQYVQGKIDEALFLEKMDYERRWGFPWQNYRKLFDFARKYDVPIVGLSSDLSDRLPLEARDDLAADFIVEASLSDPTAVVFCLFGDLHVAEVHIPSRVELRLEKYGAKRRSLIVFQNSEPIYWKLAEQGIEDTADVVELSGKKFCVLSAAPWIKWQSYRTWLEDRTNLLDEGDSETDHYHQVLDLANRIATFVTLSPKELDQFTVLTANDASLIDILDGYEAGKSLIRSEIVENRSCYLADRAILYLIDLSQNRAAEKAAQLVAAKLGVHSKKWAYWRPKEGRESFYRLVLWEAIGFFGSKVLNHKRKCDQYRDFENFLVGTRSQKLTSILKEQREIATLILAHRRYELMRLKTGRCSGAPRKLYRLQAKPFFAAASQLGKILANRLYVALVTEEVSMDLVRALFKPLGSSPTSAQDRYWSILSEVRQNILNKESKEDRF